MKRLGSDACYLRVPLKDSGLTWGVHDETPLFLAVKVSFRGQNEMLLFLLLGPISAGLWDPVY